MVCLSDGTIFNHCFCYMTEGESCPQCVDKPKLGGVLKYDLDLLRDRSSSPDIWDFVDSVGDLEPY